MGCLESKPKSDAKRPAEEEAPKKYSWDLRKKVDPKDFTIENLKGETAGRLPGTVNGMQFIIQNCEDSNIYVFDHTAQVTIDDCTNCRIFIGPIKGSVFVRDCKDCKLMLACQQFRTRDCQKIDSFLCCVSEPIIEASTGMKFGCYQYFYPELKSQFKSASMSVYNNNWSSIHDFTPVPEQSNYSYIPKENKVEDYISLPGKEEFSSVQLSISPDTSVVPQTHGKRRKTADEGCLVVFFHDGQSEERAEQFITELTDKHSECVLVQTKEIDMQPADAQRVFGSDNYASAVQQGPVIGIEYNGEGCISVCQEAATSTASTGLIFVSSNAESASQQIDNFYNFADMHMNA